MPSHVIDVRRVAAEEPVRSERVDLPRLRLRVLWRLRIDLTLVNPFPLLRFGLREEPVDLVGSEAGRLQRAARCLEVTEGPREELLIPLGQLSGLVVRNAQRVCNLSADIEEADGCQGPGFALECAKLLGRRPRGRSPMRSASRSGRCSSRRSFQRRDRGDRRPLVLDDRGRRGYL